MIKVLKYLTEHMAAVVFIIILLVLQAACELALPQYTANIVDVGIQQGGIEKPVPKVIRETSLNNLKLFLGEEEQKELEESYNLIDTNELSEKEMKDYTKKYASIKNEKLFELNLEGEELDELIVLLSDPIMITSFFSTESEQLTKVKEDMIAGMGMEGLDPKDIDMFEIITQMPAEQKNQMISKISGEFEELPELIIEQMAISYVKVEYKAIGIDMGKIQSSYIINAGLKMLGIALLAMLFTIIVCLISAKVAAKIGMQLRSRVFKKVVSFSNAEMDHFSTASLITRSTNDIQQVQMVSVMMLRLVFYAPILGIGGVIKVLRTEASMAWIIFVAVAVILSVVVVLILVAMPKFKKMQTLIDRLNLVAREILTGLPVIRAFSTELHEEKRFDKANKDLTKNALFTTRTMAFMMPLMFFIMNSITLVIIWFGAKGIDLGNLQVGDMMAFMGYTFQIVISFLILTMVSIMLPRAAVSATRIDEILDTKLVITDPLVENQTITQNRGIVEFNHVYFRYPNAESDALEDITFTARPGQTTAFIGSTGSGKSTLVNLIPRLYDVTSGTILVDGVDVKELSQHNLREKLGYVPQKAVLFSGTIDSNIRYGNETATEEEVKKAATIAQAKEFIEENPEGYKSEMSQGGTNVSGGQKQRISIARAIAKQPQFYIFDDSFSALDYKTDVTLRKALKEEMKDSTILIVAQRISTIMQADQIIVLDEGKIAGIGTHQELLEKNEVYQQIASSQLSSEELNRNKKTMEGGQANE